MVAVAVAPILCWLLRKTRGYFLLLLGVLYVFKVQFFIHSMMVNALLFFSIGSWFALCKRGFAEFAVKHFAWTLPAWMLLLAVEVYYDGPKTDIGLAIYPWMILVGVFAFIGALAKWGNLSQPVQNKFLRYAADNTFFIYVTHGIFGLFLAWIVLDRLPLLPVVRYLVAPFFAIAICLVVLWLVRRYLPNVTKVLVGER